MLSRRLIQFSLMMVVMMAVADAAAIVPFYGFNGESMESDGDSSLESGEQQLVRLVRYQPDFEEQISGEVEGDDLSVEASELMAAAEVPYYYPIDYLVVPQQGVRVARHDGHGAAPGHTHTPAELAAIQQQQQQAAAASSTNSAAKPVAVRVARHDGHGAAPGHTHTAAELAEIEKQQATAAQTAAGAASSATGGRPVAVAAVPMKQ